MLNSPANLEALLEAAPDAIVIVNRDGSIVLVNSQTLKMFGYNREELLGNPVEILVPARFKATHPAQREAYMAQPHTRPMGAGLDLLARRRDGSEFPVEISLSPLKTDDGLLVTSIIRDITERKRYEQLRRERDLIRADQLIALGQVAAGMAHELRNPLTSIKGLIQVNRKEAEARGMPAEDLKIIDQEIRRMERTLRTFLDYARPPQPNRRRLDLITVIEIVLALVRGRAEKQRVSLQFTRPSAAVFVDADQDQIQQVLLNLMLNALDVMPQGGTIDFLLNGPIDVNVTLQVRDTGPGISADLLPKIFDPFISSKETGLGLGLAVSRRIAEDHGGKLTASNREEGGACFELTLPGM